MIATLRIQHGTRSHRLIPSRGIRLHRVIPNPPASNLRSPASQRRGISLIEVLIAVFILTFGLLSVAMVIPAGRALMVEASKSDRGSACGRAALNDVQVRQWYDSSQWLHKWGGLAASIGPARIGTPPYTGTVTMPDPVKDGLIYGETYFIDPYFYAYNNNDAKDSVRHFPYTAYPERELALGSGTLRAWPDRALARRVTFARPLPSSPYAILPEVFAERLTTWADELLFSLEGDDRRPRQLLRWANGESAAAPAILPADKTELDTDGDNMPDYVPLHASNEGRFTWAAMVTPIIPVRNDGTWTLPSGVVIPLIDPRGISQYEISIVVFYNRNHYCPVGSSDTTTDELRTVTDIDIVRERSVYARLDGGGIAGGDVLLFVPDGDLARPAGYLNVKKNQWIMLKGLDRARYIGPGPLAPPAEAVRPTMATVCKWYRVISVDDVFDTTIDDPNATVMDGSQTLDGRARYVTLAGPDWNVDTTLHVSDSSVNTSIFRPLTDIAEAAIVDDVVGVYTTTVDVTELK